MSTEGFVIVQQAAGRCIELTAGYQVRDLLKQAAEAMSGFLKVRANLWEMGWVDLDFLIADI